MMLRLIRLMLLLALLALGAGGAVNAQESTPTPEPLVLQGDAAGVNPDANISFPPPVYVARGIIDIRGSANLPDMVNYFIEYRPLMPDLTVAGAQMPWMPLMLPNTAAVANDVLVNWDTNTVPDGVYELRLTLNTASDAAAQSYVRPLRVENKPSPFVALPQEQPLEAIPTLTLPGGGQGGAIPTLTLPAVAIPTLTPPPAPAQVIPTLTPPPVASATPSFTPTEDTTPRAVVIIQANIRAGDDTAFNAIGSVEAGAVLRIVGVSNRNSDWYLVDLPDGRRGWIGSGVIELRGNTSNLPRVQPPPLPAAPLPTPAPATSANLVAGIVVLTPSSPLCGQTFTVGFDVANLGSTATAAGGVVALQDTSNGTVRASTSGNFPVIQPGQTVRVNMPLLVAQDEGAPHTLLMVIDPGNVIPETNEGDNRQQLSYVLGTSDNC